MWPQFPDKLCTLEEMKFTHRKVRKKMQRRLGRKIIFRVMVYSFRILLVYLTADTRYVNPLHHI